MAERPIIFSGPMVRAILEGRKTQTRRILKPQPSSPFGSIFCDDSKWWTGDSLTGALIETLRVPYAIGDRLWLREACFAQSSPDGEGVAYPADRSWRIIDHTKEATEKWLDLLYYRRRNDDGFEGSTGKLVPPIHMPRWASRITLALTDIRVQRLHDISEDDAKAEGCDPVTHDDGAVDCGTRKTTFAYLWELIHGPGSWRGNPWVVAITFERAA